MPEKGKLWFRATGRCNPGSFLEANSVVENPLLDPKPTPGNKSRPFNDGSFYQQLVELKGCRSVDISHLDIDVRDTGFQGLQVFYRVTFEDGSSEIREGPRNDYCYLGNLGMSRLTLQKDEYITGLIVPKGGYVLKDLTFVTNQRRVHFGVHDDGCPYELMTPNPGSMKIVAFCGSFNWMFGKIGYFAKDLRWESRKTAILMRQLVHQGRAVARTHEDDDDENNDFSTVVRGLVDLDEDNFRNVMGLLIVV